MEGLGGTFFNIRKYNPLQTSLMSTKLNYWDIGVIDILSEGGPKSISANFKMFKKFLLCPFFSRCI